MLWFGLRLKTSSNIVLHTGFFLHKSIVYGYLGAEAPRTNHNCNMAHNTSVISPGASLPVQPKLSPFWNSPDDLDMANDLQRGLEIV